MPNISIEAVKLTKEIKHELVKTLTKTASEITKIPETSFSVLIKEFPIDNWGIGGKPLEEILEKQNNR